VNTPRWGLVHHSFPGFFPSLFFSILRFGLFSAEIASVSVRAETLFNPRYFFPFVLRMLLVSVLGIEGGVPLTLAPVAEG